MRAGTGSTRSRSTQPERCSPLSPGGRTPAGGARPGAPGSGWASTRPRTVISTSWTPSSSSARWERRGPKQNHTSSTVIAAPPATATTSPKLIGYLLARTRDGGSAATATRRSRPAQPRSCPVRHNTNPAVRDDASVASSIARSRMSQTYKWAAFAEPVVEESSATVSGPSAGAGRRTVSSTRSRRDDRTVAGRSSDR
jgi:hypothetical protein